MDFVIMGIKFVVLACMFFSVHILGCLFWDFVIGDKE